MAEQVPACEEPVPNRDEVARQARVRRFATGVTVVLILLCNGLFLAGIWASGVNLDELVKTPDRFDPHNDVCLRLAWQRLAGATEPIRLCSEWINLSDPSGRAHALDASTKVRQGLDGRYYIDEGIQADFRLVWCVGFVAAILVSGMWMRRYLVNRYRHHLELAATRPSA